MQWRSGEVEATIARSQEILGVGRATAKIGVGTLFKMASLAPSALRSQHNPGDANLKSVVGPVLHARWTLARNRYAASAKDLEDLRPLYASEQLYWKAVDAEGLATTDVVTPVVTLAAKRTGVPITDTGFRYPLELDRKELKRRIGDLNHSVGGDIACFEKTLDVLESDVAIMKLRANAWALGDVGALRSLSASDLKPPCVEVEAETMAFLGAAAVRQRLRAAWLLAAQNSLSRNQGTFATLPISELLDDQGILRDLATLGYGIEAPDFEAPDEP